MQTGLVGQQTQLYKISNLLRAIERLVVVPTIAFLMLMTQAVQNSPLMHQLQAHFYFVRQRNVQCKCNRTVEMLSKKNHREL